MSPVYRPRMILRGLSGKLRINRRFSESVLMTNRKHFLQCNLSLYWDCLPGSVASTLHAESKPFSIQHASQKPAVKAKTSTDLTIDAHTSRLPSSTTADFRYWKTKRKTCIQGAKRPTTELHRGGKRGAQMFKEGGDKHTLSSLENRGNIPDTFQGYFISSIGIFEPLSEFRF